MDGRTPTANGVGRTRGLWAVRGSSDSGPVIPQAGAPRIGKGDSSLRGGHFAQLGEGGRWP
jgi:hypothetical protein